MLKSVFISIAAIGVLYFLMSQNHSLREDLAASTATNSVYQARITRLITQREQARAEQRKLAATIARNQADATRQQQQLETLINENAELKEWADRPLPDDIKRLRRPAITGASAFADYLSRRYSLPAEPGHARQPP